MRALMSEDLPAPSMIVVLSFSTTIFFASPRSLMLAFSSDRPTSSEMTVPPVRVAMSCSMALRRSPKPGALTPATLRMPRILLTTRVASASPSTSSATTSSGRPALATPSSRQQLADVGDLLVDQQDHRFFELGGLVLLVVDEVRRQVAAVELHALDHFQLVLQSRALLDRDHALLADLLHRLGDGLADRLIEVRRDRADLGNRLGVLAGLGELLELLDGGDHRLVDAALEVHRVAARGDGLQALAHDRLGEHGGGRGAIAGLVGGIGRDFLHHLRAHVLEFVLELDFLRDRHAVLGDGGGAEALLEHGIAALRAQSRLDGVGEDIHAPEHALACVVAESDFFSWHCRDPRLLAFNHGHDVFFAHDHKLIPVDLDLGSAVLAEQDLVADLDVERPNLAVFENLALADRYDLSLHRLLCRGIGNHDATRGGTLLFQALHDHAVMKRTDLHGLRSLNKTW